MKEFSLTLFYYSPRVYQYCRDILCLSEPSTTRSWLQSMHFTLFPDKHHWVVGEDGWWNEGLLIDVRQHGYQETSNLWQACRQICRVCRLWWETLNIDGSISLATEALVIMLVSTKFLIADSLVDKIKAHPHTELLTTALHLTANAGMSANCDGMRPQYCKPSWIIPPPEPS